MGTDNGTIDTTGEATKRDETDRIREGSLSVSELIKKLKAETAIGSLQQDFERILDEIAGLGSRHREVMLLARVQSVRALLRQPAASAETRSKLVIEFSRVEEMLHGMAEGVTGASPASFVRETETKEAVDSLAGRIRDGTESPTVREGATFVEAYLASLSFIGEGQLEALRKHRLLDVDRFLSVDPVKLAEIMELSTNAAFELKDQILRRLKQEREREAMGKVREVEKINAELSDECETITADNQVTMEGMKSLQTRFADVTQRLAEVSEAFQKKQNNTAAAHTECNRLSIELKFLREENQRLVDEIEKTHERLGAKLKLFTAIRNNCDFIKGECSVSGELMEYLGELLNDVASQCESLSEKVVSTEERLDSLFYELNEITKEGKALFYDKA